MSQGSDHGAGEQSQKTETVWFNFTEIMLTVHSATSVALISCRGGNDEHVLMLFSAMCIFIYYSTFFS